MQAHKHNTPSLLTPIPGQFSVPIRNRLESWKIPCFGLIGRGNLLLSRFRIFPPYSIPVEIRGTKHFLRPQGRAFTSRQTFLTSFWQAVPGGSKVVVVGEVTGRKSRFHIAKSEMRDAEGRLMATAEGRFMAMSEEVHRDVVPLLKMPGRAAVQDDI
jgi:hypothetical protein